MAAPEAPFSATTKVKAAVHDPAYKSLIEKVVKAYDDAKLLNVIGPRMDSDTVESNPSQTQMSRVQCYSPSCAVLDKAHQRDVLDRMDIHSKSLSVMGNKNEIHLQIGALRDTLSEIAATCAKDIAMMQSSRGVGSGMSGRIEIAHTCTNLSTVKQDLAKFVDVQLVTMKNFSYIYDSDEICAMLETMNVVVSTLGQGCLKALLNSALGNSNDDWGKALGELLQIWPFITRLYYSMFSGRNVARNSNIFLARLSTSFYRLMVNPAWTNTLGVLMNQGIVFVINVNCIYNNRTYSRN
jgi:hypothetical protein